jgi:hypothetical protein
LSAGWTMVPILVSLYAVIVSSGSRDAAWESAGNSKRSADAATQSVDTARRSLEVTTRPWVSIFETKLQSDIVPDMLPLFQTFLRNVGNTPAQNVSAYFAVGTFNKCVCSPSSQKETFGSIAPGTERNITANMAPQTLEAIEQLRQRNLTINLCAEILYEDGFSKHRRTTANLYYSPSENRRFSICPNGNTME